MGGEEARIVRASELGEHAYCARSWWLRHIQGWEPSNRARLERGEANHQRHGTQVALSQRLVWIGLGCLALALVLALL